ncbi:hypothetical protein BaRGS_00037880 [Batillaria attramentaria]|uniref:Uncharacterized protein n=1 Tax=Batillaria attramentaria TaxID=370345 RepID=A0ABD0J7X0_9CAEN
MQKLSKRNARLKWPKEWLGREDAQGIRRLVSSNSVATDAKERKVHSGPSGEKLAVCKGTICSPNTRPLAGHIDLDLGEDVTLKDPVKVFFVPKLAKQYNGSNLEGTKYAGKRVQFHLAFTLANGYEAYTIKLLKKYKCSKCPRMMEMTSHQGRTVCSSCKVPTTTRKGAPSASQ